MEAAKLNAPLSVTVQLMNIIARVAFLLLLFRIVDVIVQCFVSIRQPVFLQVVSGREGSNGSLYEFSRLHYYFVLSLSFVQYATLAYASLQAVSLFSKQNIQNPVQPRVAALIVNISYVLFLVGIVSVVYNLHNNWLKQFQLHSEGRSFVIWFVAAGLVYIGSFFIKRKAAEQVD